MESQGPVTCGGEPGLSGAMGIFLKQHNLKITDFGLLRQALTHSSYSNERGSAFPDYQRLEYLGDSVLDLIINEYLFQKFPTYPEGRLDKMRSNIVCEQSLAEVASGLKLDKLILLGKGEKKSGGAKRPSNLADCLEAMIAAFYLDQGFDTTRVYVKRWFKEQVEKVSISRENKDAKSLLQEFTQKHFQQLPLYEELHSTGPDHHKVYWVRVRIQGRECAQGQGYSRKDAEQQAAIEALKKQKEIKVGTGST